jgi:hypothetical protein
MLRRLLDRLAELVNVEPNWSGMWDVELPTEPAVQLDLGPDAANELG